MSNVIPFKKTTQALATQALLSWIDRLEWRLWAITAGGKAILGLFAKNPELILDEKEIKRMGLSPWDADRLVNIGFLDKIWGQKIFINGTEVDSGHPDLWRIVQAAQKVDFEDFTVYCLKSFTTPPPHRTIQFDFKKIRKDLIIPDEILTAHHSILPQLAKVVATLFLTDPKYYPCLSNIAMFLKWPNTAEAYRLLFRACAQATMFIDKRTDVVKTINCTRFGSSAVADYYKICRKCSIYYDCLKIYEEEEFRMSYCLDIESEIGRLEHDSQRSSTAL